MYRWQENKPKEKNNQSGKMRKEENKVKAKKIFCWKEQFLSDNRSCFQRQSSGTENCTSSREKPEHLFQDRKQIHGKKEKGTQVEKQHEERAKH